jgi:hypothetical protein
VKSPARHREQVTGEGSIYTETTGEIPYCYPNFFATKSQLTSPQKASKYLGRALR